MTADARPLTGRRVVTTRDEPGRLDELLAALGAEVVHVPLIEIVDAPGAELSESLSRLDEVDWVVVTSRHGAARVGPAVAAHPHLRTAAVGTRTAATLVDVGGRPVTVVPERQTAEDLVDAMPDPSPASGRVLVAQADRAASTLVDGLRARGYDARAVVAYTTRLRAPSAAEQAMARDADAVAFASGSAAQAWAQTIGWSTPRHVVAIGPTTARIARDAGLRVTAVAADHSVEGLAAEVAAVLAATS